VDAVTDSPGLEGRGRPDRAHPQLRWLADTLWGGSEDVRAVLDGETPPGFHAVRSFAVVPSPSRARFLLPVDAPAAAVASLRRYNALRSPRRRAARKAVATALRTGAGSRVFRRRLLVCVRDGVSEEAAADLLLEEHLRRAAFEGEPIAVAIGVGRQGPSRKPVLQVFSPGGDPLGYVKVGWNEHTRELVRNEAEMLRRLTEHPVRGLWTPGVLHAGRWREQEISVVRPLPADARRVADRAAPPLRAIRDLAAAVGEPIELPVGASPFVRALEADLSSGRPEVAEAAAELLALVTDRSPSLRFGPWHGDLTPWNVARTGERLAAWDWEHSGVQAPVGIDAVHWIYSVAFILEREELPEAVERARSAAVALPAIGVPSEAADPLIALHVMAMGARAERAALAGAGRSARFDAPFPGVLSAVASRLRRS